MRTILTILCMGCLAGSAGETTGKSEFPTNRFTGKALAEIQFMGFGQLKEVSGGETLKELLSLSESKTLLDELAQRLAPSLRTHLARSPVTATSETGSAQKNIDQNKWIAPLLLETLKTESWFALFPASAPSSMEWVLAVKADEASQKKWTTNLWKTVVSDGLPPPGPWENGDAKGWQIRYGNGDQFRLAAINQWLVLGGGSTELENHQAVLRQIEGEDGRPAPKLKDHWLRLKLDLHRLRENWQLSPSVSWPKTVMTVVSDGQRIRINADAFFDSPLKIAHPPWMVPTNTITEPLISFTAGRGLVDWISGLDTFQDLDLPEELSDPFYLWARSSVPFMTYFAASLPEVNQTFPDEAKKLSDRFSKILEDLHLGVVRWVPEHQRLLWQGLPFLVPYLQPAKTDPGYLEGGLFPLNETVGDDEPIPGALVDQVRGRDELIYYDWELTGLRLAQWQRIFKYLALLSSEPIFKEKSNAQTWLNVIAPKMKNTVTEVVEQSPHHLRFTRRSHVGMTAFEMMSLIYWYDLPHWPDTAFRFPFQPLRHPEAQPRAPN